VPPSRSLRSRSLSTSTFPLGGCLSRSTKQRPLRSALNRSKHTKKVGLKNHLYMKNVQHDHWFVQIDSLRHKTNHDTRSKMLPRRTHTTTTTRDDDDNAHHCLSSVAETCDVSDYAPAFSMAPIMQDSHTVASLSSDVSYMQEALANIRTSKESGVTLHSHLSRPQIAALLAEYHDQVMEVQGFDAPRYIDVAYKDWWTICRFQLYQPHDGSLSSPLDESSQPPYHPHHHQQQQQQEQEQEQEQNPEPLLQVDTSAHTLAQPWMKLNATFHAPLWMKCQRKLLAYCLGHPGSDEWTLFEHLERFLPLQQVRWLLSELVEADVLYARLVEKINAKWKRHAFSPPITTTTTTMASSWTTQESNHFSLFTPSFHVPVILQPLPSTLLIDMNRDEYTIRYFATPDAIAKFGDLIQDLE
jgi:hypothetical protein